MKTPHILYVVRSLFAAILGAVLYAYSTAADKYDAEALLFVCATGFISIAGITATWMRNIARVFVAVLSIMLPLGMWLLLDIVVLRGEWWEYLIALSIQMLVPLAVGMTILRDQKVRMYFERHSTLGKKEYLHDYPEPK